MPTHISIWPVTAGAIALSAALGYHLLPDVPRKFKLLTPGSLLGTLAWFLATWGFGEYAAHIASYNITYGALGSVIVLMAWFYLTGFIFLLGGEINVIFEERAGNPAHEVLAGRDLYGASYASSCSARNTPLGGKLES